MFNLSKKFLKDQYILLLISVNLVLFIITAVFIVLRLSNGHTANYIVQCRDCSNPNSVNRFVNGGLTDLIAFIVFSLLVLLSSVITTLRSYNIHRQLAVTALNLGILLQVLTLIVSNYLLVLR
jgi:hypothetical protein